MLRSLYTGITGLRTSGMKMSVVGDNLANSQTIGFKKGVPIFQDLLAQSVSSYAGASQVGLGSRTGAIWQDFSQGALRNSNRAMDLAINGRGFFTLKNRASADEGASPVETAQYYTRAGAFDLDKNGYVINPDGFILQGYTVDPFTGEVGTGPADIQIDATRTEPVATSGIDLSLNLDPTASTHNAFGYFLSGANFSAGTVQIHNDFTYYLTGNQAFEPGSAIDTTAPATFAFDLQAGSAVSHVSINIGVGHSMADVLSALADEFSALTLFSTTAASAVGAGGGSFYLRINPPNEGWSIANITDNTANDGLGMASTGITSHASAATLAFSFGTSTAYSTLSITVADNTTLASLVAQINSAFQSMAYSGTAQLVSNGSQVQIRLSPTDADWSVQGGITDTTTSSIGLAANSSGNEVFNATDPDTYDYSTSVFIYDQQGGRHVVNVYFVKTADNTWDFYALAPDDPDYTTTPASPNGTMIFDETGELATLLDGNGSQLTTTSSIDITWTFVNDETLQPVDLTVAMDFTPRTNYGNTTQNGNSFVNYFVGQNGYGPGSLESININPQGLIMGNYSNGESLAVGRVALATFQSVQGLLRAGGTLFEQTQDSGEPSLNPAEEGGTGSIYSFSLEDSNVDIAEEFVDMIVAQRAWQSNAKTISTSDQMLQELMNVKR